MDKKRLRPVEGSGTRVRAPVSLALFAVLALLLPGCIQGIGATGAKNGPSGLTEKQIEDKLSKPTYKERTYEEATVEGAGGISIWLDIYRPKDAAERVPVIMMMTPYRFLADKACMEASRERCPYDAELVSYFVPRGFAVAFADVRGTHNSGGCEDLVGPDSWRDGYDVVEWLAARPWSNGRVAMYGVSYDGSMAAATATLQPPHLATIIAMSAETSQYDYQYYDGAPYLLRGPQTAGAYAASSMPPGIGFGGGGQLAQRPGCQSANLQAGADQSGDWNAYWEARDLRPRASAIRVSVLQTHGLKDENVKPDAVEGFWNNVTSEKRLVMGQWGHGYPLRADWTLLRLRWLDHYLKGIDTGLLQDMPPVLLQDTAGDWQGFDAFPPANSSALTFNLSADGSLSMAAAPPGSRALQDYPRLSAEDTYSTLLSTPERQATGVPEKLRFITSPLAADLHVTGSPALLLVAATNAKSTRWAARLTDADAPSDPVQNDTEEGARILDRGILDARHRLGVKQPTDLTPGDTYTARIRFLPMDTVVPKGHRLLLTINNDDSWIQQDTTFATSTVRVGGADGTRLVLPIAPVGRAIPKDTLRVDGAVPAASS